MRKLKITELNRLTVDEFKKADKLPLAVVLDEVRSLHNIVCSFFSSAQKYSIFQYIQANLENYFRHFTAVSE